MYRSPYAAQSGSGSTNSAAVPGHASSRCSSRARRVASGPMKLTVTAATASKTASAPNTAASPYVFLNPGNHGDEASNGQPTDARSHAEAGCTRIRWKYLRHKNLHGVASDLIAKDHWEAGDKQLGVAVHFDKEDGHDSRTDESRNRGNLPAVP